MAGNGAAPQGGKCSNAAGFGQGDEYGSFRAPDPLVSPSMSLDAEQVSRVAVLARLAVAPSQLGAYAGELNQILEMVDQLRAAPVDGVEPMAHPLHMQQRLRVDEVTEADQRDVLQADAHTERGHYLVPRVID